jgi:hypothetical protein
MLQQIGRRRCRRKANACSVFIEIKIMMEEGPKENLHPTLINQEIFLV